MFCLFVCLFVFFRTFFRENTLVAGVGLWATTMGLTGAYVWSKPIPTGLEVIQARMVAQAGVIGALCTVGLLQLVAPDEHEVKTSSVINTNNFRQIRAKPVVKVEEE